MKTDVSADQIISAMKHSDPRQRIKAIKAAAASRDACFAEPALQALFSERIPQLRIGFVQLVGLVGNANHGRLLASLVSDPVDAIRFRCHEAIVRIGDLDLYDTLVFGVCDEEKKIRNFCVPELLKLKGDRFPLLLRSMIETGDLEAKKAALQAAGKFLSVAMARLLEETADNEKEVDVLRSLARVGLESLASKGSKRAKKWFKRQRDPRKKAAKSRSLSKSAVDLEPVRIGPVHAEGSGLSVAQENQTNRRVPSANSMTPSRAKSGGEQSYPRMVKYSSSRALVGLGSCPASVRGVANWNYFSGALGLLACAGMFLVGEGLLMVFAVIPGVFGAFHIWLGRALKDGKSWARTLNIIFAVFNLMNIPIGTLIGALILHALYSDEGKIYFGK